jgi:hypothetical protein
VAKRQAANDNRTVLQQLQASLALELAKVRRQGWRCKGRAGHLHR